MHYQLCSSENMWQCWKVDRDAGRSALTECHTVMAGWLLEFTLVLIQVLVCTN